MTMQKRFGNSKCYACSCAWCFLACGLIAFSSLTSPTEAATVSFSNSVVITAGTDLDAPATAYPGAVLVQAVNFGSGAQAANGINFTDGAINGGDPSGTTTSMFRAGSENNGGLFAGDTGDAGLNSILQGQAWANTGDSSRPETLRIGDLTPGQAYVAQLLASDGRSGSVDRTQRYNDAEDYSGNQSDSFSVQMPTYVLASFTADASGYQDIFIEDTRGSGWDTTFAGVALYSVPVPEPASLSMLAFGMLSLLGRRKRL